MRTRQKRTTYPYAPAASSIYAVATVDSAVPTDVEFAAVAVGVLDSSNHDYYSEWETIVLLLPHRCKSMTVDR